MTTNWAWIADIEKTSLSGSGNIEAIYTAPADDGAYVFFQYNGSFSLGSISVTATTGKSFCAVAKLDLDGNFLWVSKITISSGGGSSITPVGIDVDTNGNAIVVGTSFDSAIDFVDSSDSVNFTKTPDDFAQVYTFTAKINSSGVWQWANIYQEVNPSFSGAVLGFAIAASPDGGSAVTGYFTQTGSFGSFTLIAGSQSDVFVAKVDADGTVQYVARTTGDTAIGRGIAFDSSNNCYINGLYDGTTTFGSQTFSSSNSVDEVFVSKLDSSGNFIWTTVAPHDGSGNNLGTGLSLVSDGAVILVSQGSTEQTFGSTTVTTSPGVRIPVIAKINSNGNWSWAYGITSSGGSTFAKGLATTSNDSIYVGIQFGDLFTIESFTYRGNTIQAVDGVDVVLMELDSSGDFVDYDRPIGAGGDANESLATYINSVNTSSDGRILFAFKSNANTITLGNLDSVAISQISLFVASSGPIDTSIPPDLAASVTPYIQTVGGVPTIVGVRVAATNYIGYSSFVGYDIDYKLDSLNGDWQPLYAGRNNIVFQGKSKGFVLNAAMSYRIRAIFTAGISQKEVIVTNGTENLARYDTLSAADHIVNEIIWDPYKQVMELEFKTPTPSGVMPYYSGSLGSWVFYRVTDIATGKILGVDIRGENAQGAISSRGYYYNDTFPVISNASSTTQSARLLPYGAFIPEDAGSKGIRIEFGYVFSVVKPKPDVSLGAVKGTLYFYPDSTVLPIGPVWEPGTGQKPGTGTATQDPTEPTEPTIFDPVDYPAIKIVPISENIEIQDDAGNPLATGTLPPGTPPNPLYTVRLENDIITVIYDGKIIVTYAIDPVLFPNLVNSQGWIGFVDPVTNLPAAPTGSQSVGFLPEGGTLYELYPSDEERPLGYHPLYYQYGARQQGYTVLIYGDGTAAAILEPTTDQLKAATTVFRGGGKYSIDPVTAQAIANAGYGRWISVIR